MHANALQLRLDALIGRRSTRGTSMVTSGRMSESRSCKTSAETGLDMCELTTDTRWLACARWIIYLVVARNSARRFTSWLIRSDAACSRHAGCMLADPRCFLGRRPRRHLVNVVQDHMRARGTKAIIRPELRQMPNGFEDLRIEHVGLRCDQGWADLTRR